MFCTTSIYVKVTLVAAYYVPLIILDFRTHIYNFSIFEVLNFTTIVISNLICHKWNLNLNFEATFVASSHFHT